MNIRPITVDDVPPELLASKDWDTETVLALAREAPGWRWIRVEDDDGKPLAVFTMHHDPIYDCVFVDTLLMMPGYKGVTNLKKVFRVAGAVAIAHKQEIGARAVRFSTLASEKVMRRVLAGTGWDFKPVALVIEGGW
jgi:hypothetical protein